MRLTLRTLLAYMHNALQPEDAPAIGKRIDESESATNLLHRTRDVMRRLRLGAPGVMDRKEGLDANTVSEYLDHTLPDERVCDFEEVCFTSDVHLAEVASCHQVLTLVLGEPAQVDPKSRQRMYGLHHSVVAERLPDNAAGQTGTAAKTPEAKNESPQSLPVMAASDIGPPAAPPRPSRPSAAEYLRRERRRRRILPTALVVTTIVLLGMAALFGSGQLRPGTPLGDLLGVTPTGPTTAQGPGTSADAPSAPAEEAQSPDPILPPPRAFDTATIPAPPVGEPSGEGPADPPDFPLAVVVPEPFVDPLPPVDVPAPGSGFDPMPSQPLTQPPEPVAPQPMEVGVFSSHEQILLRFDDRTACWRRLAAPAVLFSPDRLMSWPAGEPLFMLGGRIQIQLIDAAVVALSPPDEGGIAELVVDHGHLLIAADPDPDAPGVEGRLRLRIGGVDGVITFQDPQSVAALEVIRLPNSTSDPEMEPRPLSVSLLTWNGPVSWRSAAGGQPLVIEPMTLISLTAQPMEVVSLQRLPDWISAEPTETFGPHYMDRLASAAMQQEILPGEPVLRRLSELTLDRRGEVRRLAQRCLGRLGDFEPLVAALNLPETNPHGIDELRQAIARDPPTAGQVHQALKRRYGQQGTTLYEMLWRFDSAQASLDDLVRLVEYLDHEDLAFRRLAFRNLWAATNQTYDYRPQAEVNQRRNPTQRWRDWARANSTRGDRPVQEEALLPARPGGF